MNPEDRLKQILGLLNDGISKVEFQNAFQLAMQAIDLGLKKAFARIEERLSQIKDGKNGAKGDKGDKGDKGERGATFIAMRGQRGEQGYSPRKGIDYFDGENGSPDTSQQVRDKLETLQGDERLDKSAVKGIEQLESEIKRVESIRITPRGGGAKGFTLYVGGTKKLLTAQTLNLIAGTGMTLTYNYANGRNDITFTSSGSGGGILAATGTVDGSNKSFTFVSAPSQIVVDGVAKQKTQSDGTNNWTGTTSVTLAVAPLFDLYGIS